MTFTDGRANSIWVLLASTLLLGACERGEGGRDVDEGDTDSDTDTGVGCTAIDILFVVDDSGTMWEEQKNLVENFPQFIDVLFRGHGTEYRIGVTTTSVTREFKARVPVLGQITQETEGPDGALVGGEWCGLSEPWISGPGDNVEEDFECAANVGTGGSTTEMPFAAIQDALGVQSEEGGPNEGFYRQGEESLLVVVIISDEDDCSIKNGGVLKVDQAGGADCSEETSTGLYSVSGTKDFLNDVADGAGRYVVVGIAGPSDCNSEFGSAIEARRIRRLVDQCGDYGVFGDICAGDLWIPLQTALDAMQVACEKMPSAV